MWVTKLLISQVKKRIFCPKTTKFGPKLAFLVNLGQAMQSYSVPCWWVGRWLWRAGCISQDTYLLYCMDIFYLFSNIFENASESSRAYIHKYQELREYFLKYDVPDKCQELKEYEKIISDGEGKERGGQAHKRFTTIQTKYIFS